MLKLENAAFRIMFGMVGSYGSGEQLGLRDLPGLRVLVFNWLARRSHSEFVLLIFCIFVRFIYDSRE